MTTPAQPALNLPGGLAVVPADPWLAEYDQASREADGAFRFTRWAISVKVRGPAKAVLLALAIRADRKTGECWPSLRTLADDSGALDEVCHPGR